MDSFSYIALNSSGSTKETDENMVDFKVEQNSVISLRPKLNESK